MTSTYVYSNSTPHAVTHHRNLAAVWDPATRRVLSASGVTLSGASCLEVGAGAGSIASFLASQVGPRGRVVATDTDPLPIAHHNQLRVLPPHDITVADVPDPPYDLIHARLLLMHLPRRREVLRKLADALHPGGVLVVEDMDMTWRHGRVLRAPSIGDRSLFEFFHDALANVFLTQEADTTWASKAAQAMTQYGLVDVQAEMWTRSWRGGEAGCQLVAGTIVQLHDKLMRAGMQDCDLARVRELMRDPKMMIRMPPLVSTLGYRS
jgi:2-polyprenyl-3-methyl-5-hydroxy-6-metoxy-1,4-benzoquinol methylase